MSILIESHSTWACNHIQHTTITMEIELTLDRIRKAKVEDDDEQHPARRRGKRIKKRIASEES